MPGICGIVCLRGRVPVLALQSMMQAMEPADGAAATSAQRLWTEGGGRAGLAVSAQGAGWAKSDDGLTICAVTGDIYNLAALRRMAAEGGEPARGDTPADILIALYRLRGPALVHDIDGAASFAVWDQTRQGLLLVRDAAGLAPLCYARTGDHFIFASDARALLASGMVEKAVDEEALYHYLTYLSPPAGRSMVRGLRRLESGAALLVTAGGTERLEKYFDPLPQAQRLHEGTDSRAAAALLDESLRNRLQAAAPSGVLVAQRSESLVLAQLCAQSGLPAQGIAIDSGSGQARAAAKAMSAAMGGHIHAENLDARDVMARLDDMVEAMDEPVADPCCLEFHAAAQAARRMGLRQLLVDAGGDALLAPQAAYQRQHERYRRLWQPLSRLPRAVLRRLARALGRTAQRDVTRLLRLDARLGTAADALARLAAGEAYYLTALPAFGDGEKHGVLSPAFLQFCEGFSAYDAVAPLHEKLAEAAPQAGFARACAYVDTQRRLPESVLLAARRMAERQGLGLQAPYMDKRLMAAAMAMAPEEGGVPALSDIARGLRLPETARQPHKMAMLPLRGWMAGVVGDRLRAELAADASGYFNAAAVSRLLNSDLRHGRAALQCWAILVFLLWKRRVLENG